jgi:hypothetical protein
VPSQADSRNLRPAGKAPTDAPVRDVRDVAVVPTGTDDAPFEEFEAHPPADGVELGRGLTIERITDDEFNLLMAACRPRGHFYYGVVQWGQRYSFVRRVDPADYEVNPYGWDDDQTLRYALAMSRLIADTTHCSEFAARIVTHEDGEQQVIPLYGFDARIAYRYGRGRDWLDEEEARELVALADAFWRVEPDWSPRIRRAIRHLERASQMRFFGESQPRIVTGLEAVLTTNSSYVSKQFRERVTALADDLGVAGVSKRMADRMYEARSQAYHGDDVRLFSGHPGSHAPDMTKAQKGDTFSLREPGYPSDPQSDL